jgi:hypothetical protein
MNRKLYYLIAITLLLATAGCAAMDRGQSSLQDWRRSYLPTRHG